MAYSSGIQALWNPGVLQAHFLYTENDKYNFDNLQMQFSFSSPLVCIISLGLVSL